MDAHALIEASADAVVVLDANGKVLFVNAAATRMLGRPADRLAGLDLGLPVGGLSPQEIHVARADGDEPLVEMRSVEIEWEGAPATLATLRDITERKRIAERYRRATETLSALIDAAPVAIVRWDAQGRALAWNQAAEGMFGWPAVEVLGRPCPLLSSIADDESHGALERILAGARLTDEEVSTLRADGARTTVSLSTAPVFDDLGRVDSIVGVALDVSERRRRASEIRHLATHDPLTGLANRHALEEALERVVERVKRGGAAGALLIFDLDQFKRVNDRHGHLAGDQMLMGIADALVEAMRPGDLLGRLGGDELAAIVEDVDAEAAMALAERLRAATAGFELFVDGRLSTTASAGGALIDGSIDATDVMAVADLALNDAKAQGKDRVVLHRSARTQALRLAAVTRWARRLRHALDHHEVEVHAQSVVDLRSGGVHSREALARVRLGNEVHAPSEFLAAAQQSGLISDIDRHVTTTALDLLADPTHPPLSVNLSGSSIGDLRLTRLVAGHPHSATVAGRLFFEVTETALIAQLPTLREWLDELDACGARLAVDHVTLGRASLHALPHLPVALAKLDPSLTQRSAEAEVQTALRAAADLGRRRGIGIVAEAIEEPQVRDRFLELGFVLGQGFLFERPTPVNGHSGRVPEPPPALRR